MKEHQKSPLKVYLKSFHAWVKSCEMMCNSLKPAKLAKLFISTTAGQLRTKCKGVVNQCSRCCFTARLQLVTYHETILHREIDNANTFTYRVFFFTVPPPKKLKYGKPRLGEVMCI